jgi:hypothetical protein
MRRAIEIVVLAGFAVLMAGGSCDDKTSAPPPASVDPWIAKLQQLQAEYGRNLIKLNTDWKAALSEAQAGNLNADRLAARIADLRRELQENQARLEYWDAQLDAEIKNRDAGRGKK